MLVAVKFTGCSSFNPNITFDHGITLLEVDPDWVKAESMPMFEWITATKTDPSDVDVDADDSESAESMYMLALGKAAVDDTNPYVRIVQLDRMINVFGVDAGKVSQGLV
jgi:hypothetical protein